MCLTCCQSDRIHFHYYICGCICSVGPFQFRWLKGNIYSSCYNHHQIGSINLTRCNHIFPWLCLLHHVLSVIAYIFRENRDFVFISIAQFMMSANSGIRFGLQIVFVCLYITPSHYHHCANLSEDIEPIKFLLYIYCRVWLILNIFTLTGEFPAQKPVTRSFDAFFDLHPD